MIKRKSHLIIPIGHFVVSVFIHGLLMAFVMTPAMVSLLRYLESSDLSFDESFILSSAFVAIGAVCSAIVASIVSSGAFRRSFGEDALAGVPARSAVYALLVFVLLVVFVYGMEPEIFGEIISDDLVFFMLFVGSAFGQILTFYIVSSVVMRVNWFR